MSASNTYHEWQTDSLAAAVDDNTVIEGDDAGSDAVSPTVRLGNYTQISDKTAVITGTMEAVNKAGRDDEMAYQLVKRGKELKRDMESSLLANKARAAGNDTTARVLAGVPAWLVSNTNFQTGGANPTGDGTDARTPGTTPVAFDEDMLRDVLLSAWVNGGQPNVAYMGAFNKQAASSFTGIASETNRDVTTLRIIAAANIYESDFGEVAFVPDRFMPQGSVYVLQDDMWAVAMLRNMQQRELARTGDTEKRQIIVEYTLEARNEKSSGGVFDLTTAAA